MYTVSVWNPNKYAFQTLNNCSVSTQFRFQTLPEIWPQNWFSDFFFKIVFEIWIFEYGFQTLLWNVWNPNPKFQSSVFRHIVVSEIQIPTVNLLGWRWCHSPTRTNSFACTVDVWNPEILTQFLYHLSYWYLLIIYLISYLVKLLNSYLFNVPRHYITELYNS